MPFQQLDLGCEEPALLSEHTNENREAAPCACAEIKGIGITTESAAHTVWVPFTLFLERFQSQESPIRSDGDSSHTAIPAGCRTQACYKRLTELTGFHPALPAPRTGTCDCHTGLHTSAVLTAPHKGSWWGMSPLHVVKFWPSALAKLIPKGQWEKQEENSGFSRPCVVFIHSHRALEMNPAWLKPVFCNGWRCSKLLQISNTYPYQKVHLIKNKGRSYRSNLCDLQGLRLKVFIQLLLCSHWRYMEAQHSLTTGSQRLRCKCYICLKQPSRNIKNISNKALPHFFQFTTTFGYKVESICCLQSPWRGGQAKMHKNGNSGPKLLSKSAAWAQRTQHMQKGSCKVVPGVFNSKHVFPAWITWSQFYSRYQSATWAQLMTFIHWQGIKFAAEIKLFTWTWGQNLHKQKWALHVRFLLTASPATVQVLIWKFILSSVNVTQTLLLLCICHTRKVQSLLSISTPL